MDKMLLARQLFGVAGETQAVYLRVEPELPDFTVHATGTLHVMTQRGQMEIPFNRTNIKEVVSLLDVSVFTGKVVIAWNFKNLVSYIRHYTKRHRDYDCKLLDLKLMEGFVGNRGTAPATFSEAMARVMTLAQDKVWKPVYEAINAPLATRVIPTLECEGIVDMVNRQIAYAHYEIDRTTTGRMVCQLMSHGYSPHALGESENYKPRGDEDLFAYFDFRSMEIGVLQWLSGDEELGAILTSGKDMYSTVWEKITGKTVIPDKWKLSFLAVFFGMGPDAMSERHGWSRDISKEIITRMGKVFPKAMSYVVSAQERARNEVIKDHFGRPRDLRDTPHVARNHVIQSPASVVCMEKLIKLHDEIPSEARIAYSVHDGYSIFCSPRALPDVSKKVFSILESESTLCPGLKLSVSAKAGPRLNKMIPIPANWRK